MSDQLTTDEGRKRNPVYHVFEDCGNVIPADAFEAALSAFADEVSPGANPASRTPAELQALAARVFRDFMDEDGFVGWRHIAASQAGATDRKAIEMVIGTNENPVEGFDADRRLLPHVAVLTRHWVVRTRKRIVNEPTPAERAELERRLAGTVVEEWDA